MGRIYEQGTWVDYIYLIEPYDPVMGGEMGIDNIPAKQLANRTLYLKNFLAAKHAGDGKHLLSDADIADGAGIIEQKLVLDHSTQTIHDLITDALEMNSSINNVIEDSAGINGSLGASVSKAVPLSWSYSDKTFDFEMFVEGMTLLDTSSQPLLETVAGDESIDVTDSSLLSIGKTYVVCNEDGTNAESFQVAEILTKRRIRATEEMTISRTSGVVSRTSWRIVNKEAKAINGSVYYTRQIVILEDKDYGKVIVRIKDDGSVAAPYYRFTDETAWIAPPLPKSVARAAGYVDLEYEVPGGLIELKFVVTTGQGVQETTINNICVLPYESREKAETVKRPTPVYPVSYSTGVSLTPMLQGSPYRSLYGLAKKATQFQIASDAAFTTIVYSPAGTTETQQAVPGSTLSVDTQYYWRCRYQDIEDVWSEWSVPSPFTTGTAVGMVYTPNITAPTIGALNTPRNSNVFTSSAFSSSTADTFDKVQWQFAIGSSFTTVFHDSGELAGDTSYNYPASGSDFATETTYYARVRYKGTSLGWSEWSTPIYFTTAAS